MKRLNRCSSLMGVMVVLLPMSGCVVWDINDGILASNDNLGRIEDELQSIDQGLGSTNENLETVESRLASMDAQLQSLQTQLDATNAHLASLRKTINNIDSTIPFLKLSGDDEQEQEALENGEASGAEPGAGSEPTPETAPASETGGS
ncbi:MAG: hypothetical protein ACF8MF_06970 [Phycisphaerales bacterium JB052]